VEHSDILIGIWDGVTRGNIGGTRHTIESALEQGIAVIWLDAGNPDRWHLLRATEELAGLAGRPASADTEVVIRSVVREALCPTGDTWQNAHTSRIWRGKSNRFFHAYRRIEAIFGNPGLGALRSLRQY